MGSGNNTKGDLFGRLMSDLFYSLGYSNPRMNIHKSGREIDIKAAHRFEFKTAICECKAHEAPIGGADINKFVGVLDAERKINSKKELETVGYFVSTSGYTETAIQQEEDIGGKRIIMLGPKEIAKELIQAKIIADPASLKCEESINPEHLHIKQIGDNHLLATTDGWVWLIFYTINDQFTTHYSLFHASGSMLVEEIAKQLSASRNLQRLLPKKTERISRKEKCNTNAALLESAKSRYYSYLKNELGEIHFEGLPTDKESGSVKVQLENIFIPIHLHKEKTETTKKQHRLRTRISVGEALSDYRKIAILGRPGSGKSTLIKRLALSYAYPERRELIDDGLPDCEYFPIFIRCRELGDNFPNSISSIINLIPEQGEMREISDVFESLVSNSLQQGNALLLIDGLDEISDDRSRVKFTNQLRTFIATYPTAKLVITSREAGFRIVSGALSTYCEKFTVSNLDAEEISSLSVRWHKSIIDQSDITVAEALKVAATINSDPRIQGLATNPLMLTTLLFVKRWAGYLPTKRTVLYQEMIKLLLVTWNVEGYQQLDIDETDPQLCFVAYNMMKNGQQTIDFDELKQYLVEARKQFPEILGYTKISPTEFISKVESRSSLLILTGHKRSESGALIAVYEFLHLSFQEFLCAKAIVKDYIPESDRNTNAFETIRPYLNSDNWKEVVPIIAVLLERSAKVIVQGLIDLSSINLVLDSQAPGSTGRSKIAYLISSCLENEAQIAPELFESCVRALTNERNEISAGVNVSIIMNGKYRLKFYECLKNLYFDEFNDHNPPVAGSLLGIAATYIYSINDENALQEINSLIATQDNASISLGALIFMHYEFKSKRYEQVKGAHSVLRDDIISEFINILMKTKDDALKFSILWCLAWASYNSPHKHFDTLPLIRIILGVWHDSNNAALVRQSSWVLSIILPLELDPNFFAELPKAPELSQNRATQNADRFIAAASLYICRILNRLPESDMLLEVCSKLHKDFDHDVKYKIRFEEFLRICGVDISSLSAFKQDDSIEGSLEIL